MTSHEAPESVTASEPSSIPSEQEPVQNKTGSEQISRYRLVPKSVVKDKPASRILVRSVHQSGDSAQTGFKKSSPQVDLKQNENENQSSIVSTGIGKTSPSVSEMLYGEDVGKETYDSVSELSQPTELGSGMASDASDMSERRRFVSRGDDVPRVPISDSDQSVSSAMSDSSRKKRKDKSSMRKSKLNEGAADGK